jgi:hypothetical protein
MPSLGAAALATLMAMAPTAGAPGPSSPGASSHTASSATSCVVEDVSVVWGFKESFRSYLSGAIALGEWTVSGDVSYQTPLFSFSGGSGAIAPDRSAGDVRFDGQIKFVGHGGILNTTLSEPRLEFLGNREAALFFDVTGDTMDFVFVENKNVEFVRIKWSRFAESVDSMLGVWEVSDATVTLTSAGSGAFGTYLAGEVFDPLSFRVSVASQCLDQGFRWWWIPGGVAAIVATSGLVWALTRRGRKSPELGHPEPGVS